MENRLIFLIFLSSYFTKAEIPIGEIKAYTEIAFLDGLPPNCTKALNDFAESASNLTKCSIIHARPIKLCEKCVEKYIFFTQQFDKLTNAYDNGTFCRSLLISQDRLDAVVQFHNNIAAIWDQGHCSACFNFSNNEIQPSETTKHFNKLYNETVLCINNNKTKYLYNSEEICNRCMQLYLNLDEYYNSLSPDAIGVDTICMDIVDSMNSTRFLWSKILNCCQLRKTPEILFLCCTGIISALPMLFYLAVRYCGPLRDFPKVLRQSRLNQRFLRPTQSNIN